MSLSKTVALAGAAITIIAASGCFLERVPGNWEGGNRASIDRHVYVSRPHTPKTVSLVNTVTGETLWSVEVPVGRQLVVQFYNGRHDDPVMSADMRWRLMEVTTDWKNLNNTLVVPGPNYWRIDFELRPAPEYPETADAD